MNKHTILPLFTGILVILLGIWFSTVLITKELPIQKEIEIRTIVVNNTIIQKDLYAPTADCLKISYDNGETTFHCKNRGE